MDAGAYRERVEIQKAMRYTSDNVGNQIPVWKRYYYSNAYVNNLSGAEYWSAAQTQSENTVMFIFRYHKILQEVDSTKFQIIWKGKPYNITSVDNVQNKNETVKIRGVMRE